MNSGYSLFSSINETDIKSSGTSLSSTNLGLQVSSACKSELQQIKQIKKKLKHQEWKRINGNSSIWSTIILKLRCISLLQHQYNDNPLHPFTQHLQAQLTQLALGWAWDSIAIIAFWCEKRTNNSAADIPLRYQKQTTDTTEHSWPMAQHNLPHENRFKMWEHKIPSQICFLEERYNTLQTT